MEMMPYEDNEDNFSEDNEDNFSEGNFLIKKIDEKIYKGFLREVGVSGSKLSGGQRQRTAIARVVARKPKLYLFDEATSSLDTKSERIVQNAVDKISNGQTSIVISHRLSTVRNSDKILVLEGGKIVEEGKFEDLAANHNGFLREIYEEELQIEE